LDGTLTIQLRDIELLLKRGDFFVVPKGIEHCPGADDDVFLLEIGNSVRLMTEGAKPTRSVDGGA